jgi:hypothetical protein
LFRPDADLVKLTLLSTHYESLKSFDEKPKSMKTTR